MITIFTCEESHASSLKVSKDESLLNLNMSAAFMDGKEIDLKMSLDNLHSFIGHLLKIQKEIREEVSNG